MRKIRLLTALIILCIILLASTCVSAISISLEDKKVKPGEEFTVKIKIDENIVLANSHIAFDSNLFEFKGTTQENLSSNELSAGDIAWMYTELDQNKQGVNELEFKFKAKDDVSKKTEATFKLSDLALITKDASFQNDTIDGNKEFKVIVSEKGNFNVFVIIIPIVVVIILLIVIVSIKKRRKN